MKINFRGSKNPEHEVECINFVCPTVDEMNDMLRDLGIFGSSW